MALQDTSVADRAYAAGVIDSDGCVSVARHATTHKRHISFTITVQMTNIDDLMPMWFMATFGGSVGRHKPSNPKFSQVYKWSLHCRKAADFLELILPYLKLKQKRAELAIQLARLARPHGMKGWNGGKFVHGFHPMTEEEIQKKAELAAQIREANHRSNARVKLVAKSIEVN